MIRETAKPKSKKHYQKAIDLIRENEKRGGAEEVVSNIAKYLEKSTKGERYDVHSQQANRTAQSELSSEQHLSPIPGYHR
jgi:GTP cyclohydrolase I